MQQAQGEERVGVDASSIEPTLSALRDQIDALDDALLELIEQRLNACRSIATLKSADRRGRLWLRPRREEEILARLCDRASIAPRALVEHLWRDLMAASLQAQRRTELVLYASQQPVRVTNAARLRFGCASPMIMVGEPRQALERACSHDAIAIIELSPLSAWWVELVEDPRIAIFDWLREEDGSVTALAVGRVGPEDLPRGTTFQIISEHSLNRRMAQGESIRPLALCGYLRLCVSVAPGAAATTAGSLAVGENR